MTSDDKDLERLLEFEDNDSVSSQTEGKWKPSSDEELDDLDLALLDDNIDDETESLGSSIEELLESESLGSLKDLLKNQPTPEPAATVRLPKLAKEPTLLQSCTSSLQNHTQTSGIKRLVRKKPVAVTVPDVPTMDDDVIIIDPEPEVPDLREFLNRKKRKQSTFSSNLQKPFNRKSRKVAIPEQRATVSIGTTKPKFPCVQNSSSSIFCHSQSSIKLNARSGSSFEHFFRKQRQLYHLDNL